MVVTRDTVNDAITAFMFFLVSGRVFIGQTVRYFNCFLSEEKCNLLCGFTMRCDFQA